MQKTSPSGRWIPAIDWLSSYRRANLASDLVAGVIVAIMLVPQSMAYALLAGLPAQVGLYASVVPVALYALLGTSTTLAVGPVAIVSLLVASGVSHLAEAGSAAYAGYALTLALMVGVIQSVMGWIRLGFLVNFLSHAVLSGFTSAAALVIAASQLKHVLGVQVGRPESFLRLLEALAAKLGETHLATLAIGLGGIATLLVFRYWAEPILKRLGVAAAWRVPLAKIGPFVAVASGAWITAAFGLHQRAAVAVVGEIPRGLPSFTAPVLEAGALRILLPTALAIAFIGFLESFAVAKVLAARRREKVRANQELVALGVANLGAAFTGGYPVTGGFSRSMVNFTAGARSGVAALTTAGLVAASLAMLTPLFYFLPKASLAAIILVAVSQLIDGRAFGRFWRYSRADGIAFLLTFAAVLAAGVERGIVVGALTALFLHVWRTTQPHIAVVGRVQGSEHFRNVLRHDVETWPRLLLVRVDESLYFANVQHLEQRVLQAVSEKPEVQHFVLIASAVNFIDGSALETLETLCEELRSAGVTFHLAEVKGPVMDRLERVAFLDHLGEGRVFLSTQEAVDELLEPGHASNTPEAP